MASKRQGISSLIKRRRIRRALLPNPRVENRYVRELQGTIAYVHQAYEQFFFPLLPEVARADSFDHTKDLELLFATLQGPLRLRVIKAFKSLEKGVAGSDKVVGELLGIDVRAVGLGNLLDQFREQNIALVENAGRDYAAQVREIFEDPAAHTKTVGELKKELLARADISKSRAELIARDQVLKFNGQVNQARQQRAGADSYTWSTSQDERVREEHAALEGEEIDWDDPPDFGHPGQDFQCRCIAIPVFPEDE